MMLTVKQSPYVRISDELLVSLLANAPKPTPEQIAAVKTNSHKVNWAASNYAGGHRSQDRWAGQ
jgi:hypothetical protein